MTSLYHPGFVPPFPQVSDACLNWAGTCRQLCDPCLGAHHRKLTNGEVVAITPDQPIEEPMSPFRLFRYLFGAVLGVGAPLVWLAWAVKYWIVN